jgi:hypothetical protein
MVSGGGYGARLEAFFATANLRDWRFGIGRNHQTGIGPPWAAEYPGQIGFVLRRIVHASVHIVCDYFFAFIESIVSGRRETPSRLSI